MQAMRQRRLVLLLFMVTTLAIATGLVVYALRQNISLFYTPSQIDRREAPFNTLIRVGGMVVKDSIIHSKKDLSVKFIITDYQHTLSIIYQGVLPDLFRAGQGVIAQGKLINNQQFNAISILAKHDENYMPPEVNAALAAARKR